MFSFAFVLSFLAGLSTLLGCIFIFFPIKNKENTIVFALSFASGVMLTVSIIDLIPSCIHSIQSTFYLIPSILIGCISIVIGILLSIYIDEKLPKHQDSLKRVGLFSMVAIILHNIPEGIATYLTTNHNTHLGITLAIAIALHNIPEGITISIPIYFSTKSRFKAFFYTLLSGLSEPLGALLAGLFLQNIMTDPIMGILYGIIAGIMIHISIYELLPNAYHHHKPRRLFTAFLLGASIMLFSHGIIE